MGLSSARLLLLSGVGHAHLCVKQGASLGPYVHLLDVVSPRGAVLLESLDILGRVVRQGAVLLLENRLVVFLVGRP